MKPACAELGTAQSQLVYLFYCFLILSILSQKECPNQKSILRKLIRAPNKNDMTPFQTQSSILRPLAAISILQVVGRYRRYGITGIAGGE